MNRMKPNEPKEAFAKRTRDWAARLDVPARTVTIRKMRNKWASCSTAGRLTFDESLLSQPTELQDYVIVHELLHLRAPNHGKLWKSLMRLHLGDYEGIERRLKQLIEAERPLRLNVERAFPEAWRRSLGSVSSGSPARSTNGEKRP